jgi:hypothetical protein
MNVFQVIVICVLGFLFVVDVIALMRGWLTRKEAFVWGGVCFVTAMAIDRPQWIQKIARALGIGRGADLILYCAVVITMIGFWMVYVRLRALRREMTLLVRHLAIMEASREHES